MGLPAHLLTTTVTKVRPASTTDSHGNTVLDYGAAATRTTDVAWVQQDSGTEPLAEGRDPLQRDWLLMTNDLDVRGRDRYEIGALTFEVDGPPASVTTPAGFHHTEAQLKAVDG